MWGSGMRAHGTLPGSEAGWLAQTDLPHGRDAIGLADSAWAGLPNDDELGPGSSVRRAPVVAERLLGEDRPGHDGRLA